jgi:hypothetical protein
MKRGVRMVSPIAITASVKSCRNMFIFAIAKVVGFSSWPYSRGAWPFCSGWRCKKRSRGLISSPPEPHVGSWIVVSGRGSSRSDISQPTSLGV